MMNTHFFTVLLTAGLFMISSVKAYQPSNKDEKALANLMLRKNLNVRSKNPYLNIIKGILDSDKFVQYTTEIPCNVIQTLETDADEAEKFTKQIQQGKVPDIIENLPNEIVDAFTDVAHIALNLPSELEEAAEAAVTEAVKLVNDIESGDIIKDIENLPGVVVSEITAGWGAFTAGLEEGWNAVTHEVACLFGDCATATPVSGPCRPASTTGVYTTTIQNSRTVGTPRTGPISTGVPSANYTTTIQNSRTVGTPRTGPISNAVPSANYTTTIQNSKTVGTPRTGLVSTGVPSANLGIKTPSYPFESNGIKLCATAFLVVLGVVILL